MSTKPRVHPYKKILLYPPKPLIKRAMRKVIKAVDKAKKLAVRNFFHKYEDVKDEH